MLLQLSHFYYYIIGRIESILLLAKSDIILQIAV